MNQESAGDNETPEQHIDTKRPFEKLTGTGGLTVSVWKNRNEDGSFRYATKMERSYMNSEGKFESTEQLRERDLLRAANLLQRADALIEHDKGKRLGPSEAISR